MRAVLRAALLAAIAGASVMTTPAAAQYYWGWGQGGSLFYKPPLLDRPPTYIPGEFLTPGEISAILREEGYRPMSRPQLQGEVYVVQAENRNGARLRVVVHAYDGEILDRRMIARTTPDRRGLDRTGPRRDNNQAVLPLERAPLPPVTPRDDQAVSPPPFEAPRPEAAPQAPQQARNQPRVILPNPITPAQPLEIEPSRPAAPTPDEAPAPLN